MWRLQIKHSDLCVLLAEKEEELQDMATLSTIGVTMEAKINKSKSNVVYRSSFVFKSGSEVSKTV